MKGAFPRAGATAGALLGLLLLGAAAGSPPAASFRVEPETPAAGSPVRFVDESAGSPNGWVWNFGDGASADSPAPSHEYAGAGSYSVRLDVSNAWGASTATRLLEVTPEDTLRLIAAHGFDVRLQATDPRTGRSGAGKAYPQNDVFGFFTLPDLVPTSGPRIPEVFVKILDATAIGQGYWVFWGGLTDLEYVITVRENATGIEKEYRNPGGSGGACLGADTAGFAGSGTPFPTATATPTPSAPTGTATRAPTRTATATRPPLPTRTAPTPTPPAGPVVVKLRAVDWQWDFVQGPDTEKTAPYPGINTITLKRGLTYEFHVYNDGPVLDPPLPPHSFSGIAALGLNGGELDTGGPELVQTITPNVTGDFPFLCTFTDCGTGPNQHDAMHGLVKVAP